MKKGLLIKMKEKVDEIVNGKTHGGIEDEGIDR